jgi:epoxyqueuosine reductase
MVLQPLSDQAEHIIDTAKSFGASLVGIDIVGRNKLLVTPEYAPRVRLRAVFIDMDMEPTGLLDFNACESCSMPCRKVCHRNAFITGFYSGSLCY